MDIEPTLTFPVIRGLQARREYYVAMWTLRMLRQISIFDEDELPPELRAQRTLNRARIPEISDYILDNPDDYVFSAMTVSIDSQVSFDPLPGPQGLITSFGLPSISAIPNPKDEGSRWHLLEISKAKSGWQLDVTVRVVEPTLKGFDTAARYTLDINNSA